MLKLNFLVLGIVFMLSSLPSFCQTNEEIALINIYRPQESAMSGGRGLSIKVFINDEEVVTLQSGTKLIYKLKSTGDTKVKCIAEFANGPIGSPFVETYDFSKNNEYHLSIEAGSMFGVKGEMLDEKGLKKIKKKDFSETIEKQE